MNARAIFGVSLLLGFTAHGAGPAPVFRAGAANSNITPALGSSINGGFPRTSRRSAHQPNFLFPT